MGPKEIDIKLQEFEARLTMINRELDELVKTAKDIEYRASLILKAYEKWPSAFGAIACMTTPRLPDAQIANQKQIQKK